MNFQTDVAVNTKIQKVSKYIFFPPLVTRLKQIQFAGQVLSVPVQVLKFKGNNYCPMLLSHSPK